MTYRRNVHKPTAALWLLVAVADAVLLLAGAGALALAALASVAVMTVAAAGAWRHMGRQSAVREVAATGGPRMPARPR